MSPPKSTYFFFVNFRFSHCFRKYPGTHLYCALSFRQPLCNQTVFVFGYNSGRLLPRGGWNSFGVWTFNAQRCQLSTSTPTNRSFRLPGCISPAVWKYKNFTSLSLLIFDFQKQIKNLLVHTLIDHFRCLVALCLRNLGVSLCCFQIVLSKRSKPVISAARPQYVWEILYGNDQKLKVDFPS